jgi:hypothetical protein
LFARGADWFVATVLAQQGRSNGFLSVAEDGLLTGYAAGVPAAVGVAGTESFLTAVGEMTYLPDSLRAAFAAQWSDPHMVDPALLVRRVFETPIPLRRLLPREQTAVAIIAATRAELCVADESDEIRAREGILALAIDARARGIAANRGRYRRFMAPTDDPERWREAIRATLEMEIASALPNQGLTPLVPAIFRSSSASCSSIAP